MIFKNAKYHKAPLDNPDKKNTAVVVEIYGVESWVPMDEENTHYKEIMRQVDAGILTIEEAD